MDIQRVVDDRIVRPSEARRILGISKATLWRMTKRGELPRPMRISRGAVGWRSSTIEAFIDQREDEAAADDVRSTS